MVSERKQRLVQELTETIKEHPIIGMVNMESLPGPQLCKMKSLLRKQGVAITMMRKRLLTRALQESKKENINQLIAQMKGMPALIFSSSNPFTLYAALQKNKSEAPAKPGQLSPKDIMVKAGPTTFAPGPIISELAAVGIKTKVEAGKLAIIDDSIIVKEGEVISTKVAETLKRLDIKPMEIGLTVVAIWEKGLVFTAKQLHIDEQEYRHQFSLAAQGSFNLAMEIAYLCSETVEVLLRKAFQEAKALALEQEIITDLTAEELLGKAELQAKAVQDASKLEIPEKTSEAVPEKLPTEETKRSAPDLQQAHPKLGRVTPEEAKNLLAELQKKGTLRDV